LLLGPATLMAAVFSLGAMMRSAAAGRYVSKLYVNPGVTVGGCGSLEPLGGGKTAGTVLGGELSVVVVNKKIERFRRAWDVVYGGVMFDGLYDFTRHGTRFTMGPELGMAFWGIDGGYLVEVKKRRIFHGAAVRFYASLGVLAAYVRYGMLAETRDFVEAGILLKVPLGLFRSRRRREGNLLCFLTRKFCSR
jgi:hypothetical protein